ncbi:MAG: YkgJ family cysteine cluster protein [Myxococcales bacterium]|nr:YkgJ family cysteine cluster protein [Myxococcales bacterium]
MAPALERVEALYDELARRIADFAAQPENPHLCRAGCSACCTSSAFFALTLVEALFWSRGVAALDDEARARAREAARAMVVLQPQHGIGAAPRQEPAFAHAIGALCRAHRPPCPLLRDDLCSTYATRPLLCRCYGAPVDAYAVQRDDALIFRSLCALYEGAELRDYVRARDVRAELDALSSGLCADGVDVGRFTSAEAILAEVC